jgi:hypothetical protein
MAARKVTLKSVVDHYVKYHIKFDFKHGAAGKAGTLTVTVCGRGKGEKDPSDCKYATLVRVIGCWPCMENGFIKRR